MKAYDAIIIGTGQSGPSLAARFNSEGRSVAVIERHKIGGSCVNAGCIPTKTLIASARVAHMARRARDYGIEIEGSIRSDMKRVKDRMWGVSRASNEGVTGWLKSLENVTLHLGHGKLLSADTVEVAGETLQAPKIFLNVGARARVPDMPGLDQVDYMTSTGILHLEELPEHLIVVGGSYIGLEFAQAYRRFGSRVTVIQRGARLIPREDEDISDAIREILEAEGIDIHVNAECTAFAPVRGQISAHVTCDAGGPPVVGSHVLLAVGRLPNTHDLGLENAGISVDRSGYIPVDNQLRTEVPGIWAIGDCNGRGGFTHTSYNDYEIVAANLFDHEPRRVTDRIPCYGLFVDPPLGRVGMNEKQARKSGRKVLVGKRPMTKVGRAKEFGETRGFMKVMVDAETEEILGAAILGLTGDEVAHSLLDVMYAKASYKTISRAVHIHPTVTELIPTTLQSLEPL